MKTYLLSIPSFFLLSCMGYGQALTGKNISDVPLDIKYAALDGKIIILDDFKNIKVSKINLNSIVTTSTLKEQNKDTEAIKKELNNEKKKNEDLRKELNNLIKRVNDLEKKVK